MPHVTDDVITGETNPFEDLLNEANQNDTDNELPEPSIPALPPLPQDDHQLQLEDELEQDGQDELQQQDESQQLEVKNEEEEEEEEKPKKKKKLIKSYKSTLVLKTDLTKSTRDTHPSGILHFTRSSGNFDPEEHAFAWIAHHANTTHLTSVLEHMAKFGFVEYVFVPYSSRRSWIDKYPLAFPHVHCGESGAVSGFPYWSGGAGGVSGGGIGGQYGSENVGTLGGAGATSSTNNNNTPARGRKKKKIFPIAHLPNEERDELHIEMYKYFQWLQTSLQSAAAVTLAAPTAGSGGLTDIVEGEITTNNAQSSQGDQKKQRRSSTSSAAGINVSALQNLMENMESTFKVVRNAQPSIAAASATAMTGGSDGSGMEKLPFLEEVLGESLGKLVDAVKKDPEARSSRSKRSRGLDFEDMYERLMQYHQEHGHVNVPQKYSLDGQLGSWVANMRSKRKQMAKKGEEFELDVSLENDGDEDDAVLTLEGEVEGLGGDIEEGLAGKKRKRGAGGRQRLTRDRIQRLDSIGFQWIVANPNTKSWEERFEDLKEFQELHGTTRVPRSSGTLGEWVHMQRRLYNRKDKNFLARRAPLLDDIGFEWHPRKHALVSWEDNFNRLVEFGRINRHYLVSSPFPEGYVGDFEDQDGELVEAHRFSKWVKRIHAEYRAYASGKGSRMLNDSRVMQLREIGFQFA